MTRPSTPSVPGTDYINWTDELNKDTHLDCSNGVYTMMYGASNRNGHPLEGPSDIWAITLQEAYRHFEFISHPDTSSIAAPEGFLGEQSKKVGSLNAQLQKCVTIDPTSTRIPGYTFDKILKTFTPLSFPTASEAVKWLELITSTPADPTDNYTNLFKKAAGVLLNFQEITT